MPPFFLDVWMELAAQKQTDQPGATAGEMPSFTAANDDTPGSVGRENNKAAPAQT